ncbi:PLC-like phosphodiesterase [Kockovaella imperatae]|uniref:Phosphoinositide phospholipase C n=1 Tax=Kockovaella imperatae TaxID=4999 RepID=A0A1Y1U9H7_9TREE|nr:PLC-like phosphodiesterase [Kockovaella imperatae]ORX33745.1 PLC-like phosphodiesterase [Kockovaella imperatae]
MTPDSPIDAKSPPLWADIPTALKDGVPMLKMTSRKIKQLIIRIHKGSIVWGSSKGTEVPISSIRELRLNQPPTGDFSSSRWITVVYVRNQQWKVLHMSALTDDMYRLWVDTLTLLVSETSDRFVAQVTPSDPDMMWIRQLWPAGAKCIDFQTAQGLCGGLGLLISSDLEAEYRNRSLDWTAFRHLVKNAQTRPEFAAIYAELTAEGPLDRERVDWFLRTVQKLDPASIFEEFADGEVWSVESLTDFLLSPHNLQSFTCDMTKPLSHYFISSSHNTYLVGEQWRGESTVEGYIRVLLARCRCVEMDCHDGEIEPQVFHRISLTSKVPVRDICQAINKYAFVTSPYPVIISAEVHCGLEQQEKLGSIMREIFGDKLVSAPLDETWTGAADLPSPEQLKGKILLKAKPPPPPELKSTRPSLQPSLSTDSATSSTESDSGIARLVRRLSVTSNNGDRQPKAFPPILSDLLVYTQGVKFRGFSKLVDYAKHHQFSLSDRTGGKVAKEHQVDWIKHNFTHLSRVYPRPARVTSGNYDPIPFWIAGCQLVALNWQTIDEGTILNHGLFNDTLGYVLKPIALRQKVSEPLQRYRLRVHLVSAQRLPPSSDIEVVISLIPAQKNEPDPPDRSTCTISGPTLNPHWNEVFSWDLNSTESTLDLSFLHIKVNAQQSRSGIRDGLLAQWIRPLGRTPRGYHHLPLYDGLFSKYVFATLFVRIDLNEVLVV